MDNVCHTLVGAALAECGPRHRTRYATAALVIGANLPDVDILAVFTEHGLGFRRGITHGIPALILWPFVLTGLILLWSRVFPRDSGIAVRPRELLKWSTLAIATHSTLDWMNVYGMRWLMPFDDTWVSADALFIIDPWLLLLLGAAWIVSSSHRRLVASSDRLPSRGERFARVMVALAAIYIAAMMVISAYGRGIAVRELGLADATRRDIMVAPPFLESWRRGVTARVDGVYRFGRIDWLPAARVVLQSTAMEPELDLLTGLRRSVPLEDLLDWARFPFARLEGPVVYVDDARYARGGRSFAGVAVARPTDRR